MLSGAFLSLHNIIEEHQPGKEYMDNRVKLRQGVKNPKKIKSLKSQIVTDHVFPDWQKVV